MPFALGTLRIDAGKTLGAMRLGGFFWPLEKCAAQAGVPGIPGRLIDLFEDWPGSFARLKRLAAGIATGRVAWRLGVPEAKAKLATPLAFPRKLFCTGANYADHLAEMKVSSIRKIPGLAPFFFMKPPSSVLSGPGDTVRIPRGCDWFDWEAEVVAVFGKGGRDIAPGRALSHVAAYTLGIDFTARNLFIQPDSFFKFNFTLGKCADGATPVGPVIVPAEFVDGGNIDFGLDYNGSPRQASNTRHMIYSLAEQIAGISRAVTIEPGDLMFTGSPAGVGLPRGERLASGDRVRVHAPIIGSMTVRIGAPLR